MTKKVGGIALKAAKVGILAKLWGVIVAALLALKKGIILVLIALGALFKKLWGRRQADESDAEGTAPASDAEGTAPAATGSGETEV
jgi:hypothetical protein